jgi:hypothetical protein
VILCIPDSSQLDEVVPAIVGIVDDSKHDMPNAAMSCDHSWYCNAGFGTNRRQEAQESRLPEMEHTIKEREMSPTMFPTVATPSKRTGGIRDGIYQ